MYRRTNYNHNNRHQNDINTNEIIYEHLRNIYSLNQNISDSTLLLREYIQNSRNRNTSQYRVRNMLEELLFNTPSPINRTRNSSYNNRNNNNNNNIDNNNNNNNINNINNINNNNDLNNNSTNSFFSELPQTQPIRNRSLTEIEDMINNSTDISVNDVISELPQRYGPLINNAINQASNVRAVSNQNNNEYVLSFDTFIPPISIINTLNQNTRNTETNEELDFSYNIQELNSENIEELDTLRQENDLLDIEKYELIEEPVNDICPITRERINNNQNVLMICKCSHIYNKSSLTQWIKNHNTCPSCRITIHR